LEMGITIFDSSLGGLGGCPYAPGASGNVATDDLIYMLHGMDIATGIDVERLTEAALFIRDKIGRPLSSRYLQTISR
jgi:hydroxymethylglutaryl-CoA lyase